MGRCCRSWHIRGVITVRWKWGDQTIQIHAVFFEWFARNNRGLHIPAFWIGNMISLNFWIFHHEPINILDLFHNLPREINIKPPLEIICFTFSKHYNGKYQLLFLVLSMLGCPTTSCDESSTCFSGFAVVGSIFLTQLAVYTAYIPGICCHLGDYIIPTTHY